MIVTFTETLSIYSYRLSQFYRTADLSYSSVLHRASPYFIGIGLGLMLTELGNNVRLARGVKILGWMSSLWAIVWCFYSPSHLSHKDYQYNPTETAAYNAWSSLIWPLALCWIIFVCYTNNASKLNGLLGSRIMQFFNRISYSIFLIQFLVFFYHIGIIRTSEQFTLSTGLVSLLYLHQPRLRCRFNKLLILFLV